MQLQQNCSKLPVTWSSTPLPYMQADPQWPGEGNTAYLKHWKISKDDFPGHCFLLRSNERCSWKKASSSPWLHLLHTHPLLLYLFSSSSWFNSSIFSFCIPSTRARARWRFPSASVTYCSKKRARTTNVNDVWSIELFKKRIRTREQKVLMTSFRGCYGNKVDFPKRPVCRYQKEKTC